MLFKKKKDEEARFRNKVIELLESISWNMFRIAEVLRMAYCELDNFERGEENESSSIS